MIKVCGKDIHCDGRLLRTARLDGDGYEFVDDPKAMLEGLRRCGRRIDIFTFCQRVNETTPKYTGYLTDSDNFAVLPVTTFEHWQKNQIRWEARNRSKQAEKKGVTFRVVPFGDELVQGIWEVYNECPVRQGKPFRHFGKDLATVHREEATFLERSIFIGAFLENAMIGFIKLVVDETGTQANLMNIVSMVGHRDKAPTNGLVAQAVKCCAERNIPNLLYNNYSYGKKLWDGAVRFKENNGFVRVDVPRYYAALTPLGAAALKLGLHKGVRNMVPEPILVKLRQLRTVWYNRKYQSAAQTS